MALEHRVDDKTRAKLQAITVGERTLDELLIAWIDAGKRLGQASKRRAELEAALGRDGSKGNTIDVQAARFEWIQTLRGLLWAVETDEAMMPLAEGVIATIEQGIAISQRRRAAGEGEFGEARGEDEAEADGEAEADAKADDDQGDTKAEADADA